jgi:hypothetical protein
MEYDKHDHILIVIVDDYNLDIEHKPQINLEKCNNYTMRR